MYKKAELFFIKTITPLHVGSGQDLGIVDLPIQRERHTRFPKIEASGLKGSIREIFREKIETVKEDNGKNKITRDNLSTLFGPEEGDLYAGALGFTDARILLFPVKSVKGVFAWITCPDVLERFKNDLKLIKFENVEEIKKENFDFEVPIIGDGECLVTKNSKLVINNSVILEEYAFKKSQEKNIDGLASKIAKFIDIDKDRLIVLSNNDFSDFINLSTEVITRTKISNETGTVEEGALFTEEYLPSETVMYSIALATPTFNNESSKHLNESEVLDIWLKNKPNVMQIGGNATIGKGIVEILGIEGANNENNK